eukprot:8454289-Lingulodinium_polyedra.AAC.1
METATGLLAHLVASNASSCQHGMDRARSGRVLIAFRTRFGRVWDAFRMRFGRVSDASRRRLDAFRARPG